MKRSPEVVRQAQRPLCGAEHLLGVNTPIPDAVWQQVTKNGRNILNFGQIMPDPWKVQLADQWEQRKAQVAQDHPDRVAILENHKRTLKDIPTVYTPLSEGRLNPDTIWEGGENGEKPDIFFGMGGGSQSIIRGASMEALVMFLTAEAIRRKMGLGKVRAILANRITWTNLPYSPDFLPAGIDPNEVQKVRNEQGPEGVEKWVGIQRKVNERMLAEQTIYQTLIEAMGFPKDQWDIFQHSDIDQIEGEEGATRYRKTTEAHSRILHDLTEKDEYHYAMEDGIIRALVDGPQGGVKVGWYMRDLDQQNGGYIMDEQPFHLRDILGQALRDDDTPSRQSYAYAYAAPLLYPDAHGSIKKASPYIMYNPEDMLTLHPDDDVYAKLKSATRAGGGLSSGYARKYWEGICSLYEELTGKKLAEVTIGGKIVEIGSHKSTFTGEKIALRIAALKEQILKGNEDAIRKAWKPFEDDNPAPSDGMPMSLPTSQYLVDLGIQDPDLYYRVRRVRYGESVLGELANYYEGDKDKINLTRDLLLIASSADKLAQRNTADGNTRLNQVLEAFSILGNTLGMDIFSQYNSTYYSQGDYNPLELIKNGAKKSPLHINPRIAEYINTLSGSQLRDLQNRLNQLMTIIAYPNMTDAVSVASENGYQIQGVSNEGIRMLQVLAGEFFEARQKGSTPIGEWRTKYYTDAVLDRINKPKILCEEKAEQVGNKKAQLIQKYGSAKEAYEAEYGFQNLRQLDGKSLIEQRVKIAGWVRSRLVRQTAHAFLENSKVKLEQMKHRTGKDYSDSQIQELAEKMANKAVISMKGKGPGSKGLEDLFLSDAQALNATLDETGLNQIVTDVNIDQKSIWGSICQEIIEIEKIIQQGQYDETSEAASEIDRVGALLEGNRLSFGRVDENQIKALLTAVPVINYDRLLHKKLLEEQE